MKKKVLKVIKEAAKQLPATTHTILVDGFKITKPSNKYRALKKYLKLPANKNILQKAKP